MKNICVVVASRMNYGRVKTLMKAIQDQKDLNLQTVAGASTLLERYGNAVEIIKEDGFIPARELYYLLEGSTPLTQAKSTGLGILEISSALKELNPDAVVTVADRFETMSTAIATSYMNIPLAHSMGGERSGTIDESIRHAMSKFSHYHFAANKDSVYRLIKMGEEPRHIFNVGCPSIDAIKQVIDDPDVLKKYNLINKNYFILIQHPVTTELEKSTSQIVTTLRALKKANVNVLIILPNNDAGFSNIIREVRSSNFKYIETLSISDYINLLKRSIGLIGNSSSGIHETSTFNIPTINIGTRQNKRLRPSNVIDVEHDETQILNSIRECLKLKDENKEFFNPYGDGDSASKIISIIKNLDLSNQIIQKTITY